jgi:hypothetical protein
MLAERLHPEPIPSLTEAISAAFPRRTHQLLTNVAGRSCAAPLTAPARKSTRSGWAAVQRSGKRVQDFPGERAGRMNVGR